MRVDLSPTSESLEYPGSLSPGPSPGASEAFATQATLRRLRCRSVDPQVASWCECSVAGKHGIPGVPCTHNTWFDDCHMPSPPKTVILQKMQNIYAKLTSGLNANYCGNDVCAVSRKHILFDHGNGQFPTQPPPRRKRSVLLGRLREAGGKQNRNSKIHTGHQKQDLVIYTSHYP